MGLTLVVVFLSAIIIFVFSIIVKRKKPNEYWSWWISFVAVVVSVMLGVGVGILLFEYSQDRKQHDEKEKLSATLETELSGIYKVLVMGKKFNIKDKKGQKVEALLINVNQITVDDAIRSNLFDNDVTTQLINISRNIKMLDSSVDNLWAFLRIGGIFNTDYRMDIVRMSVSNIDKYQANIKASIEKLDFLLNRNITKRGTQPDAELGRQ